MAKERYTFSGIEGVIDDQIGLTPVAAKPTSALEKIVTDLDFQRFGQSLKFL